MKIKKTNKPLAVILGLAVAGGSAQMASAATIIPLTNAGFESDAVAANNGSNITPTGWTLSKSSLGLSFVGDGGWQSANSVAGAHSGAQYFLEHANGTGGFTKLSQDTSLLWSSLSVGDTLTVGAWTTYRSDQTGPRLTTFSLNDIDSSGLFSPVMDAAVGAAAGVWTQRSWTHTVTQDNIDDAALGSWGAVNVQLGITSNSNTAVQVLFDDVSLVHTAIPEPSGIALCGLGLGLLALRRKRCL